MAANVAPIFGKTINVGSALITAANTSSQGGGTIGTDIFKVFTAGANGSHVPYIRLIPTATTPTTTTATVARVFLSSITSGSTTSADTWLIAEQTLAAIGADNASTGVSYYDIPLLMIPIVPANATLLVTNHATPAANTAWRALAAGLDY